MSSEKGRQQPSADYTADARGILTTTKERVAEILEATDRAAAEIMDAASEESERIVRDTHERAERAASERMERISSLTEGVMAKAATLDRELDKLRGLVDGAIGELAKDLGLDAVPGPVARPQPASAPQPPQPAPGATANGSAAKAAPAAEPKAKADGPPTSDEDRADALQLLATQLLISGESFESASQRMSEEFGVQNPRFVLDSLDFKAIGR